MVALMRITMADSGVPSQTSTVDHGQTVWPLLGVTKFEVRPVTNYMQFILLFLLQITLAGTNKL